MKPPQRRATLLGYGQPPGPDRHATGASEKRQEDIFAPRRKEWTLKADAIIQKLRNQNSVTLMEGYELTDLPGFSDMAKYQVTEAEQLELWTLETRRLVDIVNAGRPIELEGLDDWFGAADREGYYRLDKLATQLLYAVSICTVDNELLLLEFDPHVSNPGNFQTARRQLLNSFGPNGAVHSTQGSMRLAEENDRCFHALVNYVTGTLSQVVLRAVQGDLWDENAIIAIAKLSAKIKLIGFDLTKAATVCLASAREWDSRLRRQQQNDFPPPSSEDLSTDTDKQLAAAQRHTGHEGHQYFRIMDVFHQGINVLIANMAGQLSSDRTTTAAADAFEASSIIYDTGFQQERAMICQERSGSIGGSAHRSDIHCAGFAFDVCLAVLEELRNRHSKAPSPVAQMKSTPAPYTSVYWKWTEMIPSRDGSSASSKDTQWHKIIQLCMPRTGGMDLTSMKDVITALVPFTMLCGKLPSQVRAMVNQVHFIANPGDPTVPTRTCEEVPFLASFVVRTSSFRPGPDLTGSDVTSVSDSSIARKRALGRWPASSDPKHTTYDNQNDGALHDALRSANAEIAQGLKLLDSWIVDETSITIPYRRYCWGWLGFCSVLVLGGLAIGFSVEQRITGVDPFNISVFCWALAGFLILFIKSIRVQEWPWRDFFLGRVVCKSVSEVVAVSWVDPQLLLSILLRLEPLMILNKRGPFESLFTRRDPDKGFSIDIPLATEAMNEGGCFFVKVHSDAGPAIMCVRLNRGHEFNSVDPQGRSKDGVEVKCQNLDTPWRWGKGPEEGPLFSLMTNDLNWTRVIGLYCAKAYYD